MSTITIGADLAKNLFSACEMDGNDHVLRHLDPKRDAFAFWLAQLPAGTVVAMEACSGAHGWARRCLDHGLQPRIIVAQFVKPFRKGRKTKNDRADAEGVATAARQGKHALRSSQGCRPAGPVVLASGALGLQGRIPGHR